MARKKIVEEKIEKPVVEENPDVIISEIGEDGIALPVQEITEE